jgi:four helix bundle protein
MKHNFRELKIWKDSIEIVKSIYLLTSELPNDEKFGLKSQLQRCAVSVPSNIAEGSGRSTNKDFRNFLNMSLSSSYELETQLIIVNELFQIEIVELIEKLHEIQRMIIGFKKTLEV